VLRSIQIDPKTFLRKHCELPALPEVIFRLQEVLGNKDIDFDEVAELASGDPALVGQVIKVVNSAYYSLPREVSNVKFAIGFIGLNEIHRIMLSFAIVDTLAVKHKEKQQKLWFHSFHTALCATYLSKRNGVQNTVDDLWSAALLHDIGKLVYLTFFPDHFTAIEAHAQENGCPFNIAEAELELPTSAYLGTLLCDHWKLPLPVRYACEAHTLEALYEANKGSSLDVTTYLVCVGNLLSSLSTDFLNDDFRKEIGEVAREALDYDQAKFATLMTEVEDLKENAETFMCQFV